MNFAVVFLGAGAGGALRHAVTMLSFRSGVTALPYATLTVNVVGSFVMGMLTILFAQRIAVPQEVRLLLTTGLLGGFTSFSTFSLDFATLWERGKPAAALAYGTSSFVLSIGGIFLAMMLFRSVVRT